MAYSAHLMVRSAGVSSAIRAATHIKRAKATITAAASALIAPHAGSHPMRSEDRAKAFGIDLGKEIELACEFLSQAGSAPANTARSTDEAHRTKLATFQNIADVVNGKLKEAGA